MNVDEFSKKCYVTEQYGSKVVQVDIDVLVELLKNELGSDHPSTIKWLDEQNKINKHRKKSHEEAVAWDDWKDSLVGIPR